MTLQELTIPFSIDVTTALLTDGYIPKSSALMINTRASDGYPKSSLESTTNPRSDTQPRLLERTLRAWPFLDLVTGKRQHADGSRQGS